jgi:hypothetical protein
VILDGNFEERDAGDALEDSVVVGVCREIEALANLFPQQLELLLQSRIYQVHVNLAEVGGGVQRPEIGEVRCTLPLFLIQVVVYVGKHTYSMALSRSEINSFGKLGVVVCA